jgi:hypothetical protein
VTNPAVSKTCIAAISIAVSKIGEDVLFIEAAALTLCPGTVVRSHVSKNGLCNILIQPMDISNILGDCNAYDLGSSRGRFSVTTLRTASWCYKRHNGDLVADIVRVYYC